MAKEYDIWLDRFAREAGIKSSIIVYGNINDIIRNTATSKYTTIPEALASQLKAKGFEKVIKWDRIDGLDGSFDKIEDNPNGGSGGNGYLDDDEIQSLANDGNNTYKDPADFFAYLLDVIRSGKGRNAFILDYSDYIFGNANALSEAERSYLTTLGKALAKSKSYNMLDAGLMKDIGNIVIILAHNNSTIPPSYYLNNPLVSMINVPLPGRNEREQFIDLNIPYIKINKNLQLPQNKAIKDDFIDALDGLSLCDIVQIMKLSNQVRDDNKAGTYLSFEKLINLYKYGEKVSPWEELSKDKLESIEERLEKRVKGQNDAIEKVKDVIIRAYTGFAGLQHSAKQKKPKGTLFFVGPTGVGKTELAKALAEFVFGDEGACIRFDMSEYNHEHSDQRLVGAPPGYVGYEAGGQLTNAVKAKPFCVLLFDEIEKAHGKILDKFLQILEDGRLTDGKGETVYFSETIIIFTSNIGANKVSPELGLKEARKEFLDAVKQHFVENLGRPELLNRIGDNIVAFNFISDPAVFTKIAEIKFANIKNFVQERYQADLEFENQNAAFMAIAKQAGVANGGRGLLNVMEQFLVNPLSGFIFDNMDDIRMSKIVIKQYGQGPVFDFKLV